MKILLSAIWVILALSGPTFISAADIQGNPDWWKETQDHRNDFRKHHDRDNFYYTPAYSANCAYDQWGNLVCFSPSAQTSTYSETYERTFYQSE
jgi:hypothetical protein